MSIKKESINFAPKQLIYKKLIVASIVLGCVASGILMCGLGYKTYEKYIEVADIEAEVVQMQQVVDNSRLPELEALRVQCAELTQNAGEDGSFIPTTKYTYTEMINFVNSHVPTDFHIYAVNGTLSNAGVYSYNITLYSEDRKDISGFLDELYNEDIIYCTVNNIIQAEVNVGTADEPNYKDMWLYTVNIRVGGAA